jgi:methylenetetrahydrofolate dehydrogenase (NADP+)/methenyltetrahydrofolate cyclohydrolase/formyltetrahydrofolate synthetase
VRQKERAGEEIGVKVTKLLLPAAETTDGLLQHIRRLNEDPTVHGIIVQMPVPDHMNSSAILEAIDYTKDVDGFHVRNAGELAQRNGKPRFVPCTAVGVMTLLEHNGIDVRGKRAAVIGRSDIVGMPVFQLLTKAGATVTLCHTQTTNLIECTREADVLVVAAGKPEMIRKEHVKPGSVVVDVGIHTIPGTKKLCGDVKFDEVVEVASAVSPVPGGVGPLTVAMLLQNTVRAAKAAEEARQKRMQYIPLQLERPVPSDDEISRKVTPKPIMQVGRESGFLSSELYQYGEYKVTTLKTDVLSFSYWCFVFL